MGDLCPSARLRRGCVERGPPRVTSVSLSGLFDATAADGVLTAALGRLTHLRHLELSHLQISESIPSALGQLASLEVLDLTNNQLTGSIPPALGQLASLEVLDLVQNQLSGAIPTGTGPTDRPTEAGSCPQSADGSDSTCLGTAAPPAYLSLNSNHLTGPIPPALGQLVGLGQLDWLTISCQVPSPLNWGSFHGWQ